MLIDCFEPPPTFSKVLGGLCARICDSPKAKTPKSRKQATSEKTSRRSMRTKYVRINFLYNFVCVSPFLVFFLVCIVPQRLGTDLQNYPAIHSDFEAVSGLERIS
jgi:hypothetical protein